VSYLPCDVCGTAAPSLFLRSERLDGPLVRCGVCGMLYVGEREHDFTFAASDAARSSELGASVDRLQIVDRALEEAPATRRLADARELDRVEHLRRFVPEGGRLLDVGCSLGGFLHAAGGSFVAEGIEPDPATAEQARAQGLTVTNQALREFGSSDQFDVVTLLHVIEHLDSPREALSTVRTALRPGGVVFIETPTVENLWFALAPNRWRQLIPDHYWFFSLRTLSRLLRDLGFEPLHHRTVSRSVTLAFALDRLRRAQVPAAGAAAAALRRLRLDDRQVQLNPGDILQTVARRTRPTMPQHKDNPRSCGT
jgi:2-polyprenyl-3-methyl-5-hydroxy-6-metoxy-1,4-benzoquinol methylase